MNNHDNLIRKQTLSEVLKDLLDDVNKEILRLRKLKITTIKQETAIREMDLCLGINVKRIINRRLEQKLREMG